MTNPDRNNLEGANDTQSGHSPKPSAPLQSSHDLGDLNLPQEPERWRGATEGIDRVHTDLMAQVEAQKDEKAIEALGQQLRFFLARWRYVHPQQWDSDAARDLAREIIGRFSR